MLFSVIVVVRNDRSVKQTLQSLRQAIAGRQYVEVIVVDASRPGTLRDIRDNHPEVVWVYFKNTSRKRFTIPEQRNLGIKKARGEIVIFIDASCEVAEQWLPVMEKAFMAEKHEAVAGLVTAGGGKKTTHDQGYETRRDNQPLSECGAANLAVRKQILQAVGGFDTEMSYGEDVDLTWRLTDAGHQIIFKKEAVITHDWGDFSQERRRAFRYGQSRSILYQKHLHRWRGLLGKDNIVIIYPLFILGLPLTYWLPFYPLLLIVPLIRNRRYQPFKTTFLHLIYGLGVIKGLFKAV